MTTDNEKTGPLNATEHAELSRLRHAGHLTYAEEARLDNLWRRWLDTASQLR